MFKYNKLGSLQSLISTTEQVNQTSPVHTIKQQPNQTRPAQYNNISRPNQIRPAQYNDTCKPNQTRPAQYNNTCKPNQTRTEQYNNTGRQITKPDKHSAIIHT